MVCGNDLGSQEKELQTKQQLDNRQLSLQTEWDKANISGGTLPSFFDYKGKGGEAKNVFSDFQHSVNISLP